MEMHTPQSLGETHGIWIALDSPGFGAKLRKTLLRIWRRRQLAWRRKQLVNRLETLDDRLLRDIGVERGSIPDFARHVAVGAR